MRTIILAAGQGTRLRPYTDNQPKCMVPLANKPLLHWQLDSMAQCNVNDNITVVGGYCSDRLDLKNAVLAINPLYDQTNMVSTLFCAREYMRPGEDLLISYGDIIFEPRVLKSVLDCPAEICVAADSEWRRLWEMRMEDPLSDAETFQFTDNLRIKELGKKPSSYNEIQAQYLGLIRVRGDKIREFIEVYDTMDKSKLYDMKDFDNMYMTSFIQHFINLNWDVQACLVKNGWIEIDTVEDKNTYEAMEQKGELNSYCNLNSIG